MSIKILNNVNVADITEVSIIARRWYDGINTYHSTYVSCIERGKNVYTELGECKFAFGHNDMYQQTAIEIFREAAGIEISTQEHGYLNSWCKENNIVCYSNAVDVKRKREL